MRTQPEYIIRDLEVHPSRLNKEGILESAMNEGLDEFFEGVSMALDTLYTFGVKQVPVKEEKGGQGLSWANFKQLAESLHRRELTGHAARDAILLAMGVATDGQWNDFYRRILIKDLRCGVSEKTVNKVAKAIKKPNYSVPVFECMLAHDGANHEGKITDWFEPLKEQCRKTNSKIFLDCAFYGTTLGDTIDTSDPVFDAVAFSLSKNFLLGGWRVGIVFGDKLAPSLTVPIDHYYDYNYFNIAAVECGKIVLSNFKSTYITEVAKPIQIEYCSRNNLTPADIWMWAFDANNKKICITGAIQDKIQEMLNK